MLAVLSVAESAEVGTSRTVPYDLLLKLLRRESQSECTCTPEKRLGLFSDRCMTWKEVWLLMQ